MSCPIDSAFAQLFEPRELSDWPEGLSLKTLWSNIQIMENVPAREFRAHRFEKETALRLGVIETVEDSIRGYSYQTYRSWMSDLNFMARLFNADQLIAYAPNFVALVALMPLSLKLERRSTLKRYLERRLDFEDRFVRRHANKFTRSAVILYPAEILFSMADGFVGLLSENKDQSARAIKRRVATMVRSIQLMSDADILCLFQSASNYTDHLLFLREQCLYYHMDVVDVFSLSDKEN
ncbi:hypothetical protein [Sneathiella limimaris]|uniref:hypothetical protein n=1 Tax=Sneathiella limimaris TaxID=1964213 RepID=UPI00146CE426|nr:hypothetical protein [Sneathiella limimaris]